MIRSSSVLPPMVLPSLSSPDPSPAPPVGSGGRWGGGRRGARAGKECAWARGTAPAWSMERLPCCVSGNCSSSGAPVSQLSGRSRHGLRALFNAQGVPTAVWEPSRPNQRDHTMGGGDRLLPTSDHIYIYIYIHRPFSLSISLSYSHSLSLSLSLLYDIYIYICCVYVHTFMYTSC